MNVPITDTGIDRAIINVERISLKKNHKTNMANKAPQRSVFLTLSIACLMLDAWLYVSIRRILSSRTFALSSSTAFLMPSATSTVLASLSFCI